MHGKRLPLAEGTVHTGDVTVLKSKGSGSLRRLGPWLVPREDLQWGLSTCKFREGLGAKTNTVPPSEPPASLMVAGGSASPLSP